MKFIRMISLLCMLTCTAGCNKILEVDPSSYIFSASTYYETEEQLNTALRGVYAILGDDGLYGNNMLGRMGLEGDEGYCSYSPDMGGVAYYNSSPSDPKILAYWKALYDGINRANALLENVHRPAMDEQARLSIQGQALFLRGYYYFMLVTRFGEVPLHLKQTTKGDPEEVHIAKSRIKDVYAQILVDMEGAADLVPETTSSSGQIKKTVVWGMLSRVSLYMAGYPLQDEAMYAKSAGWAKKVMDSGRHQLNPSFERVFINYAEDLYDLEESLWEVEFWGNGTGVYSTGGMVGRNNGIANTVDDVVGYSVGVIHPTAWFYDLYDPEDLRRDWTIAPYVFKGNPAVKDYWTSGPAHQRYAGKYRREYEKVTPKSRTRTPINFPLLRYSDVLLMYAEATNEVEKNPTAEAYEAINQVRRRARGKQTLIAEASIDLTQMSYVDFKNELLDERARELAYECLRKDDLIRRNILVPRMRAQLADAPTTNYVYSRSARMVYANASARDVLWPIPSYELGINKNLLQNNGW